MSEPPPEADPRARARELARLSAEQGDANGWFEQLYVESQHRGSPVPWADLAPNPWLVRWFGEQAKPPAGRALVVGCGYGDDAELLAASGLDVTAFDVAPAAIARCRRRFAGSTVHYAIADVLRAPRSWTRAFDFVFEAYTVQVLRGPAREDCARAIGGFVAPGGTLLVVARSRRQDDPAGDMPWPLTRAELDGFLVAGMQLDSLEEAVDPADRPVHRFVAEFTRRAAST